MKSAHQLKQIARDALKGKWSVAITTSFIATVLGAGIWEGGSSFSSNNEDNIYTDFFNKFTQTDLWKNGYNIFVGCAIAIIIWAFVQLVIGGAIRLGYCHFNLKLIDKKDVTTSDLFSKMNRKADGFCLGFLTVLYTALWSLLFVVPGIIKSFSYALAPYIMAEHPGMTANEAITESRRYMKGNKGRLFELYLSFIGWYILCALPLLIAMLVISLSTITVANILTFWWVIPCFIATVLGELFLTPYVEATSAAFYRDITTTLDNSNNYY